MRLVLSALLFCLLTLPTVAHDRNGDDHKHTLIIDQPWVRTTGNRTISAAVYLKIDNQSGFLEKLMSVDTELAGNVQIHRSQEVDGIMQMRHVEDLPIAPDEKLALEPGGYHIMLTRLKKPLKEGDVFPMTLTFDKAGDVTVHVLVTGIAGLEG